MLDQSNLATDLGKKLELLRWRLEKPELFIIEYFASIKSEIDLNAQRLIDDFKNENSNGSSLKIVETNTVWSRFIEFLEKMEASLHNKLQEAVKISAFEGFSDLEKRVEAFSTSSKFKDSVEMEEAYLKLALDIIEATNELEGRLFDNHTIIYLPSKEKDTMGKLMYLGKVFMNQYELSCFKSPSDRIHLIHETIQAALNDSLVVGVCRPLVLTWKVLVMFEIISGLSKPSETPAGVVTYLEGSSMPNFDLSFDDTQFYEELNMKWNKIHVCCESLDSVFLKDTPSGFNDTEKLFCNLFENRLRRLDISSNLVESIESIDLNQNQLESIDVEQLADAAKLRCLSLVNACLPSTRFSLGFLTSLPDLVELRLTLPDALIDFEVFQILTNMQVLEVHSATSLDSSIHRVQLTKEHFQLLSTVMTKLSSLHLSHFKIESLQKDMLSGFAKLRDLALIDDEIAHIEDGAFIKYSSNESAPFKTVDLANNLIRSINSQMFQGLEECTDLDLGYNLIEQLPSGTFAELKYLRKLYLNNNLIKQITHGVFNNLLYLLKLDVDNNLIESIDPGSFEGSTRIVKLSLANNKITSIVCLEIDQSNEMEKHGRKISSVFRTLSSLRYLLLQGNQLEKLNFNCFADLTELFELNFSNNRIKELNETIQPEVLPKLGELDLSKNQLTRISRDAFSQSTKLRILKLSGNRLETLDEEFFHSFRWLAHIDLEDNNLSFDITELRFARNFKIEALNLLRNPNVRIRDAAPFKPGSWDEIRLELGKEDPQSIKSFLELEDNRSFFGKINELSLVGCSIESFDSFNLDDRFSNLKELDLRRNRIDKISLECFTKMPDLSTLNLAENLIETLDDPSLFKNLKKLENLNLSGNKLKRVHRQLFKSLNKLQTLDLSNNAGLLNLDCGMFRGLFCLEKLNLAGNNIAFFDLSSLFRSCRVLECLDLFNNQLDNESINEASMSGITAQNLKELMLANNHLERMDFVRNLYRLEKLDLSGNKIESVTPNGVNLLSRLVKLNHVDLSDNQIESLDIKTIFSHLKFEFKFLDISNNPFCSYKSDLFAKKIRELIEES